MRPVNLSGMMSLENEVRQFCREQKVKINTDLGQHFLIDRHVLDAILDAAAITQKDHIVEIGAGIGILTRELLKCTENVMAIEIDAKLIPLLHRFTKVAQKQNSLTVIEGNALKTDMPSSPYKIVANIPYHITSPLLRHLFLESDTKPSSLTLLLQREVAEKICDEKGAGMLTIIVGLFGKPGIVTNVPPASFLPPPKVASSVLHIESHAKPKASPDIIEKVFTLTKLAFSQRRKKLRNTLGALPDGTGLMRRCEIDEERRPQTLTVDEWIRLAQSL